MPLRGKLDRDELREIWQLKLWAILGGLALLVAYVVAFVTKNTDDVDLDFVLFSAQVSLIWAILLTLVIGVLAGLLLSQVYRRRMSRSAGPGAPPPPESPPG